MLSEVSAGAIVQGDALGVDLRGKMLALDHDGVIHIIREHGTAGEALRGQVPITEKDIGAFDRIFNAAILEHGNPPKAKDGTILLGGNSELDGWVYGLAAKVRRLHIVPYTLFKRSNK